MTDPERPPSQPNHPDDRELDEFLARRGAVADAWRKAGEAPQAPPSLDAPVLALAAESLRTEARNAATRSRLHRWRIPLSAAATLVIGVGLVRLAMDDPSVRRQVLEVSSPAVSPNAAGPATETPAPMDDDAKVTASSPLMQAQETPAKKPAALRVVPPASSPIQSSAPSAIQTQPTPRTSAADAAPGLAGTTSSPQRESTAVSAPAVAPLPAPVSIPPPSPSPAPPPPGKSSLVETSVPPPEAVNRSASKDAASASSMQRSSAEAMATMSAPRMASRAASYGLFSKWQPGSWQGLRLGSATRDDLIRRFGEADFQIATRPDRQIPDTLRHQLMRYEHDADPRGIADVDINIASQALTAVTLELSPALPIATVLAQEDLAEVSPQVQIPHAHPCLSSPALPPGAVLDPTRYPLNFVYADRGVVLLLSSKDLVTEIAYYDRCD